MKSAKKIIYVLVIIVAILAISVSANDQYSTKNDPLVSFSYVNDVLGPKIMAEVLAKIESEYVKIGDVSNVSGGQYNVVTLNKDQTVMAKSVLEIIVVEGSANTVVTSDENIQAGKGINDVTAGNVLINGAALPVNHYLVAAKGDGRGFVVTSDSITVLIRGEYNITD